MLHSHLIKNNIFNKMENLLSSMIGPKDIIVDDYGKERLDIFFTHDYLLKMSVNKYYKLESIKNYVVNVNNIIFIVLPNKNNMDMINSFIISRINTLKNNNKLYIFFTNTYVPIHISDYLLNIMNRYDMIINVNKLGLNLIPFDNNLIVLDNNIIHEYDKIDNYIQLAHAINCINCTYGIKINFIAAKGHNSIIIKNIVTNLFCEEKTEIPKSVTSVNNSETSIIMIDRSFDIESVLLTQATYAGSIDEIYSIKINNTIDFFEDATKKTINLNCDFYEQNKDMNIIFAKNDIISRLNQFKKTKEDFDSMTNKKNFKNLSLRILKMPDLSSHLKILESIFSELNTDYFKTKMEIEYLIISGCKNIAEHFNTLSCNDLVTILRYIILYSVINNGIDEKIITDIKKYSLQTNDEEFNKIINHMVTNNIIKVTTQNKFGKIMNILVNHSTYSRIFAEKNDYDNTYYYNKAYHHPMIIKLLQCKNIEQFKNILMVGDEPYNIDAVNATITINNNIILFIFGGITMTELAIIKSLNKNILVVTTEIINGNSFVKKIISSSLSA